MPCHMAVNGADDDDWFNIVCQKRVHCRLFLCIERQEFLYDTVQAVFQPLEFCVIFGNSSDIAQSEFMGGVCTYKKQSMLSTGDSSFSMIFARGNFREAFDDKIDGADDINAYEFKTLRIESDADDTIVGSENSHVLYSRLIVSDSYQISLTVQIGDQCCGLLQLQLCIEMSALCVSKVNYYGHLQFLFHDDVDEVKQHLFASLLQMYVSHWSRYMRELLLQWNMRTLGIQLTLVLNKRLPLFEALGIITLIKQQALEYDRAHEVVCLEADDIQIELVVAVDDRGFDDVCEEHALKKDELLFVLPLVDFA